MEILILVEGRTEDAFSTVLRDFLSPRLPNNMPNLDFLPYNGRIPTAEKLKRAVENGLRRHEAVIALTDVYTGTKDFKDANDAKHQMRQWVGNEPKFYPHVALHDFEAWLIPYWSTIQKLAGHNKAKPSDNPEQLNHNKPPSYYVKEIYEAGTRRKSYRKPRDGINILKGQDLLISANACPELKAFLNTILRLSGGELIP
jgi:hypothetical protein